MDFLKRKVFGVPVVYIGGLFVAFLAFIAWRMKPNMSSASDGSTDTDATSKDAITGADNPYDMFKTTGTVTVQQGSDPATVTPIGNRNNEAWARQSAEWLTANGTASDVALTTMMKYVNGEQLSIPEGQLRDRAVKQFGYPPEAFTTGGTAPNTPVASAPAGRQFSSASGIHYVKGESDNTYAKIAALYIGTGQDYTNFLSAHNEQLPANGTLQTGIAVKVPKYETKLYQVPAGTQMNAAQIASKNGASAEFISRLNNAPASYVWGPGRQVRVR
jgi:hypothetical protein